MGKTATRLALDYVAERSNGGEIEQRTAQQLRSRLLSFTIQVDHLDVDKITRRHIQRWCEVPHLKPHYRAARLSALRCFFRWLTVEGHIQKDPTAGLKAPRLPPSAPRALVTVQAIEVARSATDIRDRVCVLLMLQEGMRRAEVAAVQLGDLDLRALSIQVRGKGGKGAVTRTVPLSTETARAVDRYLVRRGPGPGPLIRSYKNPAKGVSPATIGYRVTEVMKAAGVKEAAWDGKSPHALRHTMATDVLEHGAAIHQVQRLLGHSSVRSTEIYTKGATVDLRDAHAGRRYLSP